MQPAIDVTKPIDQQPAYLRLHEVALLLRRSVRAIARWEHDGLLRGVVRPAGGVPLVPRAEIERILREGAR
jgi:predicted site-specific integrase-resolvase